MKKRSAGEYFPNQADKASRNLGFNQKKGGTGRVLQRRAMEGSGESAAEEGEFVRKEGARKTYQGGGWLSLTDSNTARASGCGRGGKGKGRLSNQSGWENGVAVRKARTLRHWGKAGENKNWCPF